jgi:hypothetical protein
VEGQEVAVGVEESLLGGCCLKVSHGSDRQPAGKIPAAAVAAAAAVTAAVLVIVVAGARAEEQHGT